MKSRKKKNTFMCFTNFTNWNTSKCKSKNTGM